MNEEIQLDRERLITIERPTGEAARGGSAVARSVVIDALGEGWFRELTNVALSDARGNEAAASVLSLLLPPAAVTHILETRDERALELLPRLHRSPAVEDAMPALLRSAEMDERRCGARILAAILIAEPDVQSFEADVRFALEQADSYVTACVLNALLAR